MENYKKSYDAATRKLLSQAADIDRMCLQHFDAQYTLYDITYVLRSLYADEKFRRKFCGAKYLSRLCAMDQGILCAVQHLYI